MKFFLDTANLEEIKKADSWGILDGVTTNPTLVSKETDSFQKTAAEILKVVKGPVSLEVISEDSEGMVREARELKMYGENVVIKIPLTKEGLKAVKVLSSEGIKTNVTLCFSPTHALLAAKAGADIATVPSSVMEKLFNHPLTDIGIEKFLKDWDKVRGLNV